MFVTVLGRLVQISEADYERFLHRCRRELVRRMSDGPRSKASSTVWTAGALDRHADHARTDGDIIARYVRAPEKHFPRSPDPVTLRDMNAVSDWARDGVGSCATGIIAE